MNALVYDLFPVTPVGHYLRVGHTDHRQLEVIHGSGRLDLDRVVISAAFVADQKELIDALHGSRTEIILDPQFAELATPGGALTRARKLPWAKPEAPHTPDDFAGHRLREAADKLADFAILHKFDAVSAPTHLLGSAQDDWLAVDRRLCPALRSALDSRGGRAIAIDYSLLTTYQNLLDGAARKTLISYLAELQFDNIWLRIANFGSDKSPAGLRKYINALRDFHAMGRPVIADCVGGLPALAVAAFGAAGGICHGLAKGERFYPNHWRTANRGGGGSGVRVYFGGTDMYLKAAEAKELLNTRGAKGLLACSDICCHGNWENMIQNPKPHYLRQTTKRVRELGRVPELRRVEHFLSHHIAAADRAARKVARFKVPNDKMRERLLQNSRRMDDLRHVLEDLHTTDRNPSRSRAPESRFNKSNAGRSSHRK